MILANGNLIDDEVVTAVPLSGSIEREASYVDPTYSVYVFDWGDQGATGSANYGFTDHDTGGKMSGIVV